MEAPIYEITISGKGVDIPQITRMVKDMLSQHVKHGPGIDGFSTTQDMKLGIIEVKGIDITLLKKYLVKIQNNIRTDRGWNFSCDCKENETILVKDEKTPMPVASEKNYDDYYEYVEKRIKEKEDSWERDRAYFANEIEMLQKQIEIFRDKESFSQKEKFDMEKQYQNKIQSLESAYNSISSRMETFSEDPSKAAVQITGKKSKWVRKLDSEFDRLKSVMPRETINIKDILSISDQNEFDYYKDELIRIGLDIHSAEDIDKLKLLEPFENTSIFKEKHDKYIEAKEEFSFYKGIQDGNIKIPTKFQSLIIGNINVDELNSIVGDFERSKKEHILKDQGKKNLEIIKTKYQISKDISKFIDDNRIDPLPLFISGKQEGENFKLTISHPKGISDGLMTGYIQYELESICRRLSYPSHIEKSEGDITTMVIDISTIGLSSEQILQSQKSIRAELIKELEESALYKMNIPIRFIEVLDIIISLKQKTERG